MNNKEWLERLAHEAPDELAAWFDAEHVEPNGETERKCAKCAEGMGEYADNLCDPLKERIAELQRKLEILKAHGVEIVDAVAGGYEVYNEAIRERDELRAKVDEQQETLDNDCRDLIEYDKALDAVKKERDDLKAQLDQMRDVLANGTEAQAFVSPVFGEIEPREIVEYILENDVTARVQLQLHKLIWDPGTRGV